MIFLRHRKFVKVGYLTGFYFIWYSIERFYVEGMRTDSLMISSLKVAQVVSIVMFLIGLFVIVFSYLRLSNYNITYERKDIYD